MKRRVAVTGLGILAGGAMDATVFWDRIAKGESAIGPVSAFDPAGLGCRIAAELHEFAPASFLPRQVWRRLDRSAQLALCAAALAWEGSRVGAGAMNRSRVGVFEGTSLGPLAATLLVHRRYLAEGCKRAGPAALLTGMTGAGSGAIAAHFGLHGPTITLSEGSTSSANAIGLAFRAIRSGELDAALAGGAECPMAEEIFATFACTGVLTRGNDDPARAVKPFDRARDGFALGEGGCFLLLEDLSHAERRGAGILAEIAGYGESTDAFHPTSPDPEGTQLARAMTASLEDAGLGPEAVGYLNAHGTATAANDPAESRAIHLAFGDAARTVQVSSTKPVTGHLLGACGAVEAAVSVMALNNDFLPPSVNLTHPDPACDLDYVPPAGRRRRIDCAMSTNLSFGGRNSALLFRTLA